MIKLVVLDLDNTLYDWVGYYVPAFEAMVSELQREHGVERERLLDDFRRVHQSHGTSEYAFVLTELDVLRDVETLAATDAGVHPAIAAFRKKAGETLRLYDGVRDTLVRFRSQERGIVAYTDAMMAYADLRLEQLDVADLFDELVATRDHPVPQSADDQVSYFAPARFGAPTIARHSALDLAARKPDPAGLIALMRRWGVSPDETIYVGDSLSRDVAMAQAANVHDVHAAYGQSYTPDLWDRLVRVTHWTPEDVARERRLAQDPIPPTHAITSFPELIAVVETLESDRTIRAHPRIGTAVASGRR
jgi:phosphoglycolate phosphatase